MPNGTQQVDNPIAVAIALFLFASVAISIGIEIARKKRKGRYKAENIFNEDKPHY